MIIEAAYTFDDVLLQPAHSTFGPADANVNTFISNMDASTSTILVYANTNNDIQENLKTATANLHSK